MYEIDIV